MTKKNKFNKQYDNIQESLTLGSNPSFENGGGLNVGGKGMNMGPEQISFLDIIAGIAKEKRKRQPDSPIIGYPLQNKIPDELADVVYAYLQDLMDDGSLSFSVTEHRESSDV